MTGKSLLTQATRVLARVGLSTGSLLAIVALTVAAYLGTVWALTHADLAWVHQGDTTVAGSAVAVAVFGACWEVSRRRFKSPSNPTTHSVINNLPPEPATFTDRRKSVAETLDLLSRNRPGIWPLMITAGVGGIGKTALALHCAHRGLREHRFPGGVLYINLQGYGETKPLNPQAALYTFLRLLGVPDQEIPQDTQDRTSFYRTLLASRAKDGMRTLVLLDNAEQLRQVEPLLPGDGENPALITTRETFSGLGARRLDLEAIPLDDAVKLITQELKVTSPDDLRLEGHLNDAHRIATACGRLPLALSISAAILRSDPHLRAADLAAELESPDVLRRLDIAANESMTSPTRVFAASYSRLSRADKYTFRILGTIPGLTVSTTAVSKTAGVAGQEETEESLTRLQQAHLVTRDRNSRRWQMHDLVRRFAAELIESPGRQHERMTALTRVLRHYDHLSSDAERWISSDAAWWVTCGKALATPHESSFTAQEQAFAFLDAEKGTLIECVRVAGRDGFFETAWGIGISLDGYLNACRDLVAAGEVLELACDAARQIAPVNNEMLSEAHNRLGWALREMGNYAQASENHRLAVRYAEAEGLREQQCVALEYLGVSLWHERRIEDALAAYRQTIDLTGSDPDLLGIRAMAINDSGLCHRSARRFDEAIEAHQNALRIFQDLDAQSEAAIALCNVGRAQIAAGRPGLALSPLKESIEIYESFGRRYYHEKALAVLALGIAYRDDGQRAAARKALDYALRLFELNNDLRHQAMAYRELARNERSRRRARSAYTAALARYRQLGAMATVAEVEREKAFRSRGSQLGGLGAKRQ